MNDRRHVSARVPSLPGLLVLFATLLSASCAGLGSDTDEASGSKVVTLSPGQNAEILTSEALENTVLLKNTGETEVFLTYDGVLLSEIHMLEHGTLKLEGSALGRGFGNDVRLIAHAGGLVQISGWMNRIHFELAPGSEGTWLEVNVLEGQHNIIQTLARHEGSGQMRFINSRENGEDESWPREGDMSDGRWIVGFN